MNTLEKEVKQNKFQNKKKKSFVNILYTSNYLRDRTAPVFKEKGILQQHYNVLKIIIGQKGKPTSPGQIIEVMIDKGRDLTRLVDKLVKKGYLERRTSKTNRRKVEIFISPEGKKVAEEVDLKIMRYYDNLNITEEESLVLNKILDKIRV